MLPVVVALAPVVIFLAALVLADSFKLVHGRMLALALAGGAGVAFVALGLHRWLFDVTGLAPAPFSRYVAPLTEETLKALVLVYPLRKRRIGFLVDAAIVGFAIGTGFALVENAEYLGALADRNVWLWLVRGFGTAILHATTTAVMAVAAKALSDRRPGLGPLALVPGWAGAVLLHSAFNHALVSPVLAAALLMVVLPLVVMTIFSQSEKMTRAWMGEGLDLDVELLGLLTSDALGTSRVGRYLQDLRSRFPGTVVLDMFCLLQIDLELAIRAKGMLIAREAGIDIPMDQELRAKLAERAHLKKEIGPTGLFALRPLQASHERDEWSRYLLAQTE